MSLSATRRLGANLKHRAEPESDGECGSADRGELEAAFAMFGTSPAPGAAPASAEIAYLHEAAGPVNPAANAAGFGFAKLKPGRVRLDIGWTMKLIPALDWVVVALTAEFAALWGAGAGLLHLSLGQAAAFVLGALALKAGLWVTDVYRLRPGHIRPEDGAGGLALGALFAVAIANFVAPDARAAAALAAVAPASAFLLAGLHAAIAVWLGAAHRNGLFAETIVIVGATEAAGRFALRAAANGRARIVAVADERLSHAISHLGYAPLSGNIDDLLAWDHLPHVDRIVIALPLGAEARVRAIIAKLSPLPNRLDLLLDYPTETIQRRGAEPGQPTMLCVSGCERNSRGALLKRALDLIVSAAALILLAPLMLIVAAWVRLESRGSALVREVCSGVNNRIINVLRFRTLRADTQRATRIGALIRRAGIEAAPQFFNVLKGEMSLVGPRPLPAYAPSDPAAKTAHRLRVKPGMTGWAQVNCARTFPEAPLTARQRLAFDLQYVAQASLWLDLVILFRAVSALFVVRKQA